VSGPLPPKSRYLAPDFVRGVALLLILPVNALIILQPPLSPGDDGLLLIRVLAEGKGYALFAFLFGWGVAHQFDRGMSPRRYLRRLAALAVIGLGHGLLLWPGDILLPYAICGAILLPFRGVPTRPLVIAALLALAIAAVHAAVGGTARLALPPGPLQLETFGRHLLNGLWYGWTILGCMLLGKAIHRTHFLQSPDAWRRVARRAAVVCIGAGLPVSFWIAHTFPGGTPAMATFARGLFPVMAPFLAGGYGVAVVLASRRWARRGLIEDLARAGRMPLTLYVMQSILLFGIHKTGLTLSTGLSVLMLSLAIFSFQVVAAVVWLRHFRRGPLEAAWRWMTYAGKPMPRNEGSGVAQP